LAEEEISEEIDDCVSRVRGDGVSGSSAVWAERLHGFAGESDGGAGTGGRGGGVVLGGARAAEGAGQARVEGPRRLIAAHVIASPSQSLLAPAAQSGPSLRNAASWEVPLTQVFGRLLGGIDVFDHRLSKLSL
jgi:hypothetical protein